MVNKKYNISVPRMGMNKSTDYRNLDSTEYTHASNINLESVDGDFIDATYEKSNILEVNLPLGYTVVGRVNRLSNNYTYLFLHNPTTKRNIFGYVDNNITFVDRDNIQEPLETVEQTAYNKFVTLINDACLSEEEGFNFHIDFPILNIVVKEEKTGAELYFTDYRNPSRYIQLDNIEHYFTEEIPCDDDKLVKCPNIEKMRIHTLYKFPEITNVTLNNGGSLAKGSYVFLIALTDSQGNEISEYTSITQPIDVWEQSTDGVTNKAIRLSIESLDENFSHYKIVVLFRQHLDAVSTPFEVGTYPSSVKELVVSSLNYAQRTSLEKLSFQNQKVIKSEGLTVANNSLLEYGLVFQKEINLQPITNILGSYLEWQTHVASEDIYNKGDYRSKYLGINRNEVVPYGIRFLIEGGTTTPIFPLVGREVKGTEKSQVPVSNRDRKSIEGTLDCSANNRVYNWQYYNTAEVLYTQDSTQQVETEFEEFINCTIEDVATVQGGTYTFDENSPFYDLETYINSNIANCGGQLQAMGICQALNNPYPNAECDITPDGECDTPTKIKTEAYVSEIIGEQVEVWEETDPNTYTSQQQVPPIFNPYSKPYTQYPSIATKVYKKQEDSVGNTTKQKAVLVGTMSQSYVSDFLVYLCSSESQYLNNSYNSPDSLSGGIFKSKLNNKAKWFEVGQDTGKNIQISKDFRAIPPEDNFPNDETLVYVDTRRISFFRANDNNALYSFNYNSQSDQSFSIYKEAGVTKLKRSNGTVITLGTLGATEKLYFVIETPMTSLEGDFCIIQPTWGGYTVTSQNLTNKGAKLTFESLKISLNLTYKKVCSRVEFNTGNCEVQPYQRGSFSYWESELTYPDNQTLFDSTKLVVKETTIPQKYRTEFKDKFAKGSLVNGEYKIKDSFNLACKPIRHFKFPDNNISPFMTSNSLAPFSDSLIYPLGVTINEEVINFMLDIAVDSELINKKTRDSIYGYEIFRGDLSVSRSVFSSGLLYDLRSYQEDNKTVYYSNYPYNTYRDDVLNQISKSSNFGQRGSLYTFHSPETDYSTSNSIPTELNIQGYQFGNSSGYFDDVEDHPKWTILSGKAYRTAAKLATLEVIFNIAKDTANIWANWNFFVVGGLGSTGASTPVGQIAATAIYVVAGTVSGIVYEYGRARHQWQETFRNLGRGSNFASYYFSKGHYNYLTPSTSVGNSIRSLQTVKNIKDGRYEINNKISGEPAISLNNIDREWSVFMNLGNDNYIEYPSTYSNYDTKSLTFMSESGQNTSGRSAEIVSKIASPYVQVVNYNPVLHGNINSVVWLSASYRGDLKSPSTNILPIFGGDTYISRHTLKRKIPLFLTTAMGQSMTTPFEYKFYNNIGSNPKFYVNYNISEEFTESSQFFPQIVSELAVDNKKEEGFYVVSPSKFYLYYYGIPSFLTETRINTNYRESGRTPQDNFYPEVGDIGRWTQENTVSIREPNFFKYSNTYSNQTPQFNSRVLGTNYTQTLQDKVEKTYNAVITSLPDVNENSTINPWLRFRPLDFYEFETKFGKLTELKGIENEAILARFEDTSIIYNKVDTKVDDGNQSSAFLGGTSIFQRRTTSFVNSELGFGGSKHKESLSCEFGHFYADLDRGQVIQIPPGGGNMIEISNVNQFDKSTNMKDWFKRNLPLKILKSNIQWLDEFNIDNAYNKVGITFGYDSLHKRILITKKDYVPLSECPIYYTEKDGFFTDGCIPPEEKCPEGYERVTEIIECGLRLAMIIDNTNLGSLNNSINYFKLLLPTLSGEVKASFYYFGGDNPVIIEDLDLAGAITFINSFVGVISSNVILNETFCIASSWLNQDMNKQRVLHLQFQAPQTSIPDFECSYLGGSTLDNITTSLKESGIIHIGSGDVGFIWNNQQILSPGMLETSITPTTKILNQYKSFECSGEVEVIDTCKRRTTTPMCPTGFTYNQTTKKCDPINSIPQKENYNSLDVVYYLGYRTIKSEYDNHKNAIIASINALSSRPNYSNNRYALVIDEFLKSKPSKYRNLVPFTTNKQDIINALNSLVHVYEHNSLYYTPDDLVMESIMMNYEERSKQDNSFISGSSQIGDFRTDSNVGRVIYRLSPTWAGSGLKMKYRPDGTPTYDFLVTGDSKEFYDYQIANRVIMQQKNIQIFTFENSQGTPIEPTPANNYHVSFTYTSKNIVVTTPCYHYYESYFFQDQTTQIVQSINNIGYTSCEAESIESGCGCTNEGQFCVCYDYASPSIEYNKELISLDDPNYFKEVSWTITYNPQFGMFTSFQDYLPNYYINHHGYFSSGRKDLGSIWSHNVTNKSFGVYYGSKHPMEIEVLTKATDGSYLGTISLFTEAKRYYDNQDFHINTDLTFNRSVIYNKRHCSGLLKLDLVKGGTRFLSRYPITVSETEQAIPITKTENRFNYSYFFDRRIRDKDLPFIKNDENQIKIEVDNVSFTQKLNGKQLPRIFGDFFLNRLYYDTDSRFAMTIKLQKSLTNLHMSE